MGHNSMTDAVDILRAIYWREVRALGDELRDEVRTGEVTRPEQLHDRLHEAVDGHEYVVYTWRAQAVLLCSPNANAYVEECGTAGLTAGATVCWSTLAYFALRADVQEELARAGDLFAADEEGEE